MLTIELTEDLFHPGERPIASIDQFEISGFRYHTGVAALRVSNAVGEMIVLPFQGQQIWDLTMFGRRLTMRSMFDAPRAGVPFLQTYGAFLLHCGFSAMGGPGPEDSHQLHGELPNIPYDSARLLAGEDEHGSYVAVAGTVEFAQAFGVHYRARPELRMYAGSGVLRVLFRADNLNHTPIEYMYLSHVNFRPVDDGLLEYTAVCDTNHIRVRDNIPSHLSVGEEYRSFLSDLAADPALHNRLSPELPFDPEAVLFLSMFTDSNGYAHSIQRHPSGDGDVVSFRPTELDHAVRWICRTPNQAGLGLVLPATAEPDGYTAELKKGNVKTLEPGGTFSCDFYAGALSPPAAEAYAEHIRRAHEDEASALDVVALDAQSH